MGIERISASSDLGGMNPDLYMVRETYLRAGFKNVGLEVVWLKNQNQYIHDLSCGFRVFQHVDGFHGQLGSVKNPNDHAKGKFDWALIQAADAIMPRIESNPSVLNILEIIHPLMRVDIIGERLDRDIYLNVHDDVVKNEYDIYRACVTQHSAKSHLTIENGPSKGAVEQAHKLVDRLRNDTGKRVTGTFDIVHAIVGLIGGGIPDLSSAKSVWDTVLKMIDPEIDEHLHFPIGTKEDDSLPILEMIKHEPSMLKDLADVMGNMRITIENQHNLLVGLWFWEVNGEVERLKRIHEAMQKVGMIAG